MTCKCGTAVRGKIVDPQNFMICFDWLKTVHVVRSLEFDWKMPLWTFNFMEDI